MNPLDSSSVLDRLVRTGIWSNQEFLSRYKRLVLDVESISTWFFHLCVAEHMNQLSRSRPANQAFDFYSATLINYREYSRYVDQLLDFFVSSNIEPILVYEGKFVEAPIFGLTAARFDSNSKQVAESIRALKNYDKFGRWAVGSPSYQLPCPSLALNIFKSVVNVRRRSGAKITTVQAFYSALPVMVRLARDFRCPVITDRTEFILMDVRAGFVLVNDFWSEVEVGSHPVSKRSRTASPKSPAKGKSKSNQKCTFHLNRSFLRQHPGLNPELSMDIFPLNVVDFIQKHSKSLKSANIYKEEYKESDLYPKSLTFNTGKAPDASVLYSKHQASANRLDMLLNYLCSKTVSIVGNMVRGIATKNNSSFDVDFRQLFNYYAVAYEFKHRLRFILNYVSDPIQLNYIEWCLINRECTAGYLLDLLCCSIGHLASVIYNSRLQFEDLLTRDSSLSHLNRGKAMLMSLFSSNVSHKSEHSASSKLEKESITRYSTASLTVIDREYSKIVEHDVSTTHEDAELESIRERLKFELITSGKVTKQDSIKFINLVFRCQSLVLLEKKMDLLLTKFLASSQKDDYFKKTYKSLFSHFRDAIINHYLYINEVKLHQKHPELAGLVDTVKKHDLENVASQANDSCHAAKVKSKSPSSDTSVKSRSARHELSKHIRHLIEMLNSTLESYLELNAFFNYPLPRVNLHLHYNPILIYNLTLHSEVNNNNKILIKFYSQ